MHKGDKMSKTNYQIQGRDFLINGKKTYSEIPQNDPACHGLLFNARFIQGLFQDVNKANAEHYNRFGKVFDPEINTDELIAALPQWYNIGLRAFTIGLMGGGPCMSYKDWGTLKFGSFSPDGRSFDPAVRTRLEKVLKAADELGMLVIVSFLYHGQFRYFNNDEAIENACHTAVKMLCELDYDNVIIEVANEYDVIEKVVPTSVIGTPEKMAELVQKCQQWCGGRFAVGASTCFVEERQEIVMKASDICLFHGNDKRRQELHNKYTLVRGWCPDRPIVVNEDSQIFTQMDVAMEDHFSWGYYNNWTKQEPPCDWGITDSEDVHFAARVAQTVGLPFRAEEPAPKLLGFEPCSGLKNGERFIRVTSARPDKICKVVFYEDGRKLDAAFAEPFFLYPLSTWHQAAYLPTPGAQKFTARVVMYDGSEILLEQDLTDLR